MLPAETKGVALALFEHRQAHHDGGVLLLADGAGRLVAHLDVLGAVDQLDALQGDVVVGRRLADQRLVAQADDLDAILLDGLRGPVQRGQRGVVVQVQLALQPIISDRTLHPP